MSILQKILDDMYIEPSLLEKLTDVQKQILFCKMREEQVRRWKLRESEEEKIAGASEAAPTAASATATTTKARNKSSDTRVKWLLGKDGQPWVWVMGEHPNDKSIDEILEEETKQKARQLAAMEASHATPDASPTSPTLAENHVEVPNHIGPAPPSQDELQRREAEIYQSLKKAREEAYREAEVEAEIEAPFWEEQERRAKEADEQIRQIARKAREQHRLQSLQMSENVRKSPARASAAHALKQPYSRVSVIQWYRDEEYVRRVGTDKASGQFMPWFHGLIDREEAELLLRYRPVGSFLVRLSDRIFGYVVSCQAADKVKHFLVQRTDGGYQFFGPDQMVHADLSDLVAFHEKVPITQSGMELLLRPVGQQRLPPDYTELLPSSSPDRPTTDLS